MKQPTRIPIDSETDIVAARAHGRTLAGELGFSSTEMTVVATAISEVARNIIQYAQRGEIELSRVRTNGKEGLMIVARDAGPGIQDISQALEPGYSSGNSLGLGLPGAKRLVDEFEIASEMGKGTTVIM